MWNILKSKKGISLIEVLITTAILGGTAAFTINIFSEKAKAEKILRSGNSLLKHRSTIIQMLRSPDAITKTGKENNLECLEKNTGCATKAYFDISTLDGAGLYLTDKNTANLGFGVDDKSCTTYPSIECPYRFETKLKISCADAACGIPQFKVLGQLKVVNDPTVKTVVKNYEFEITLGQSIDSYERSCSSLGGTYQSGNPPSCLLALAGDCPPAPDGSVQVVTGYDLNSHQKICKPVFKNFINGKTCLASTPCTASDPAGSLGEVMIGIAPNGDPVCRPMRLNPGCATACDTSPSCTAFKCQLDPSQCPPAAPAIDGGGGGGGDGGCDGGDGAC